MDLTHFSAVVADDHRVCRIIIREVLKSAGMDDIREASDGAEAYQRVCERPPDILFLDLEMPCDGLSTLRKIRASNHSHIRELGIIMATAHTSRDRIVALRDAGASEVLTSPCCISLAPLSARKDTRDPIGAGRWIRAIPVRVDAPPTRLWTKATNWTLMSPDARRTHRRR
jgi:CheY-like chemotaxis protein